MLLAILASCGNKKAKTDPFASITQEVDSMRHTADSIPQEILPEEPKPTQADESFDDFIYNFASDDALQRQRVKFPLPYYNGDEKSNIEEHYWKHDDLFTKQHYYTLLFDREEDMDLVGDTSLTSVQVEWIFVKTRMMKNIILSASRERGYWRPSTCGLSNGVKRKTLWISSVILPPIASFKASVCRNRCLLSPPTRTMISPFWRQRSTSISGLPSVRCFPLNVCRTSITDNGMTTIHPPKSLL